MMGLKKVWLSFRKSPAQYWIIIFLALELFSRHDGGVNATARIATLQTLSDSYSFKIDKYIDVTCDWAQTRDGSIYSNKAPGPVLAAYPFFWVMERIPFLGPKMKITKTHETVHLPIPGIWYRTLLSLVFQMLPFFLFAFLAIEYLVKQGLSRGAIQFAALTMLFGNTAVIFMNSYFGHGFAAWLVLALGLALVQERYFWAGLALGWGMLSDYGVAMMVLPLVISLWPCCEESSGKKWGLILARLFLGGLIPGVIWVIYHTSLFGSPFALPMKFQNPMFVSREPMRTMLWGVIGLPSPHILKELLVGGARGLLWTQPWVILVALLAPLYRARLPRVLWITGVGGLLGFLWMNASFNGWHGGGSAGPRYLSPIFPLLAFLSAWVYEAAPRPVRKILVLSAGVAIALRVLIYTENIQLEMDALWPALTRGLVFGKFRPKLYFMVFTLALGWATWMTRKFYALQKR